MRNFLNIINDLTHNINIKLKENKWTIILLSTIYIIGIIFGIAIKKSSTVKIFYIEYTEVYYQNIFSVTKNSFSVFFIRVFNNIFYFAAILLFSLSIFLMPMHFLLLFYRGFVLGTVCVIIFTSYSVNGVFLTIFVVIPQNIITTFFIILAATTGIGHSKLFWRYKCFFGFKQLLLSVGIIYLLSLLGAVYELLLILLFFRPLNLLF